MNEEYVYYFYEKTNIQKPIGRIVVNVPKNEIVDFTITEEKHSDDNFKKMLDFAVLEKGYTNIRVLFGKKEMVEKLTDYGFVIAQRVKNSKGKFYIMELKNKSFNIFGTKYKIKFVDNVLDEEGNWMYGRVDTSSKEIQVSIKLSNGKDVQENEILITLYHEIIHAILLTGQYVNSSNDEPLVEWLARCILSLKNQKIL